MTRPTNFVIDMARDTARDSPCAKSKRGAVIMTADQRHVPCGGFNGPPDGFVCNADESCRRDCAKRCMHAEARAILALLRDWTHLLIGSQHLQLVHLKVDAINGRPVTGGGPSCWQCSRELVENNLGGIWLAQCPDGKDGCLDVYDDSHWRFYPSREFHELTLKQCGIS